MDATVANCAAVSQSAEERSFRYWEEVFLLKTALRAAYVDVLLGLSPQDSAENFVRRLFKDCFKVQRAVGNLFSWC